VFGSPHFFFFRSYEDLWPFADAWAAAAAYSSLGGVEAAEAGLPSFLDGLAAYHQSHTAVLDAAGPVGFESAVVPPLGRGGEVYFDDNAWVGLSLVRHHELAGDPRALQLARRVFDFIVAGWSTNQAWGHPGGIRWKHTAGSTERNACTNSGTALLGALVHRQAGDPDALEWSIRLYDWVRATFLSRHGLYYDRVATDGIVSEVVWSYNQGTMIGAGVALHRITGETAYLDQAVTTATAAIERFTVGSLLETNRPAFDAVFFRNVLLLDQLAPDRRYRQVMAAYGQEMWAGFRDPRTGLFRGNMGSPLNNSAPMAEIYALLAGGAPRP
jgi:hypothetical protein